MSQPPRKKIKGTGRHLAEWESPNYAKGEYYGLFKASNKGPEYTLCIPCRFDIKVAASGIYDLKTHVQTKGHKEAVERSKKTKSIDSIFTAVERRTATTAQPEEDVTMAEVMFCYFVAEHNLQPAVADHFSSLAAKMFPDSKIAKNFSCRRTKLTMMTRDSIAPHHTDPVVDRCKSGPFSLLIDESNDRNEEKRLVILVRYFEGQQAYTRLLDLPWKIHTDNRKSMLPKTLTGFLQVKINCDDPCHSVSIPKELLQSAKSATKKYNDTHKKRPREDSDSDSD